MGTSYTIMGSKITFATRDEGQSKISTPDIYTDRLSDYELQAKIRSKSKVTAADYLQNCKAYVRSWANEEVTYLGALIRQVDSTIATLKLSFELPKDILFVKTTGWEEGGANGYTRENAIYFNEHSLSLHLLIHELFHIVSRTNPQRATAAYQLLGFEEIAEIRYEDLLRISNPDAPFLRHALTVTHNGEPCFVCLVIRGSRPYYGGGFFGYVRKKLLVLEKRDKHYAPKVENRQSVFLDYHEVNGLYQQIGRNTGYNIHQEEVTAVHFEHLLMARTGLPNQSLVGALRSVLR